MNREPAMKKSRLLGALCVCIITVCATVEPQAAIVCLASITLSGLATIIMAG